MSRVILGVALLSMLSGCAIRRQPAALPPRPLIPPPPSEPLKIAMVDEPPPLLVLAQPELPGFELEFPSARPPRPRPVKPVVVRSKKDASEPAKPMVGPKPAAPSFRLGEILTPGQRSELNTQIDQFQGTAEQAVRTASGQNLNADQQVLASQVHALVLQSKRARSLDLVESRKLAERAKTLADALLRSLGL